jgi:hypothetical protein
MDDVAKNELIQANQHELEVIIPKIDAVDWKKRRPTADHLVLLGEFYRLLLTESWLKDVEYRFQLDRLTSITGLSEHEINVYVEIGGWLGMDRRMETMPDIEKDKFWDFLNSFDEAIDMNEITEKAKEATVNRAREIEELNRLFEGN